MWTMNQIQDSWFHTQKTVWEIKTIFHSTQYWWFTKRLIYSTYWKISLPPQLLQNNWKHHVADVRHKEFESTPGEISTHSDYAKQFIFEPGSQLQNELFDNKRTLSMEGCCLDRFRKTVNVSNFYENCGGYVHQSNDMVKDFHFNFSDSKLQNSFMTISRLYTILAMMFEKNK